MGRQSWPLGAFFIVIGLLFTVLAPGGLGEPTLVVGILFLFAAFAPEGKMAVFGRPRVRLLAIGTLITGAVLTLLDWGLGLGGVWDWLAAIGIFGGIFLLTVHVSMRRTTGDGAAQPRVR